jgi:hypothetical protein
MAFNGTGTFTRLYNWVNDKANGFKITASRMDGEFDGIATGLSTCITKDGQTTITANIPFANYKITGLGTGNARSDSLNIGQLQDNQFLYLGTTSGSADAYTLAPTPTITSYATTQQFTVKIHATNTTTTPYLQISGIANPSTTAVIKKLNASKAEIAVEASDLIANGIYKFQRNSANDAWIVLNPEKSYLNLVNATQATNSVRGISYLSNPITIAFNSSTSMDISAGVVNYDNGSGQLNCSAITGKILQASGSWTAGSSNNGLDTGARANSTWYNIFKVINNTTNANDILYSTSRTSPTVPSGYTLVAWIGAIRTNSSGNIDSSYLAHRTSFGQIVRFSTGVYASGTGLIPEDNTTPQNTEGDEYMQLQVSPLQTTSKLEISCNIFISNSRDNPRIAAIFQDSNANAIASGSHYDSTASAMTPILLNHFMTSGTTNTTTFKVRAGSAVASTTYFNGLSGGQLFNGTMNSSITIKEYI